MDFKCPLPKETSSAQTLWLYNDILDLSVKDNQSHRQDPCMRQVFLLEKVPECQSVRRIHVR